MISVAQACGEPGAVRFWQNFDAELRLEWLELVTVMDVTQLGVGPDAVRWTLDPSGVFTVKSMYSKLSQGASVAHFKDVWDAKLPLKVKIFTSQLVINKLPTRSLIAAILGPSMGRCALCDAIEDVNHIFITCSLAKFMWSFIRQLLDCAWSPANFPQFSAIVANLLGGQQRVIWALFAAQSWALWLTRNKLSIESKLIKHPADVIFKTLVFLQLWTPAAKPRDQPSLRWLSVELKKLHAVHAPRLLPSD
jgi:hypothetical protein